MAVQSSGMMVSVRPVPVTEGLTFCLEEDEARAEARGSRLGDLTERGSLCGESDLHSEAVWVDE